MANTAKRRVATPRTALGLEIRRRRTALLWTRAELGKRAGLSPNYIGSIEHGRRDPGLSAVSRLARGLDVPVSELLGGSGRLSPAALEMGRLFERASEDMREGIVRVLRSVQGQPGPRKAKP